MPARLTVLKLLSWAGLGWQIAASVAGAAPKAELPVVPAGFEVELVAGPPLVDHPTMGGFDPQGRLYVCDGPGMNLPAKDLLRELPNKIVRLEDTDGDGRFDRSTPYADKMTFPMGAVWYRGSVYTASPPNIWKLTDADDDGVAERREILVSEFGFNGNAADIHGCFLNPDGRLYWCDGRHGHNFVDEHGNQISKGLAARVFSCTPDGKQVETFAGGGMDNPVECTFTAEGEPLGTVAIFDVVEGRHDALVHWVYGGAYPRYEQPCVQEFKRTGDLLPSLSRFGQVAPAGVERMRSERFGPEFRDNIFLAQFNTHCVVRTQIVREGATFRSRDEDFLTSASKDFHPTDVIEDADGSLLVIDTGGWFRIGCPLSQTAKPEIRGGIYRIRRTGTKSPADPRGLKLAWHDASVSDLVVRLADARFAVRERAVDVLAARGQAAVEPLHQFQRTSPDVRARGLAVWALARIDAPQAREPVRLAMTDRDASVRQIAVHAIGVRRDAEAFDLLCELVESDAPQIRRDAATALGRLGVRAAVPVLLSSLRTANDRFLEHSLIYALIQLNDRQATAAGLTDKSTEVRRGALVALDQMPAGQLTREEVIPLFDTSDVALQKAVIAIIERHPGWAAETVGVLGKWLDQNDATPERAAMLRGALLAFAHDAQLQKLVMRALAKPDSPIETQVLLLDVMGRADLSDLPAAWAERLSQHLMSPQALVVRQAVAAIGARRTNRFDEQLSALARDTKQPSDVRFAALVLVGRHGGALDASGFALLLQKLSEETDPIDRLAAADGLGAAALTSAQLQELVPKIAAAGPLELPALVQAFEKKHDAAIGRLLIAALEKSSGTENLSLDALKKLLASYPDEVRQAARPLVSRLSAGVEQQRSRLAELAGLLDGGNAVRGRAIFFDKKASCSACHRARGEGATIGPDLSKIGQIRAKADLLEAVVFPSASLARGYESFSVVTDSGQVYTGILGRQTPDSIYLRTAQREEVRINRSEIEQMAPAKVSIMPQGFDKVLSPEELRDVFAFVQSLK